MMKRLLILTGVWALPFLTTNHLLAQQQITIQIEKQSEEGTTTFDTTFTAPDNFDLQSWLEQTRLQQTRTGESVSTTVIISDAGDQEATADIYRPEQPHREPGMMGVYLNDSDEYHNGVPIESVIDGSAADQAGLMKGDTIIEINGHEVWRFDDLVMAKRGLYAGDEMPLIYRRGADTQETVLLLTGRKPEREEEIRTHSPRAFLGVYTADLTAELASELGLEDLRGVYLKGVVDNSAAAEAGLEKHDVIIRMNGREVEAAYELSDVLRELGPGDELTMSYIREGEERETTAILTKRSSPEPKVEQWPRRMLIEETRAYLGVTLHTDSDAPGVPIIDIAPGSAADEAGLQAGDIIMKIDGRRTENYDSLASVMRNLSPDETVVISYLRDERRRRTNATLGYKTTTTWVKVNQQDHLNPEYIIGEVRTQDRRTGDQLARWMEVPNLEMDFFELYPNPNRGVFTIHFEQEDAGDLLIRVFNPMGETVYERELQDFSGVFRNEINLGDNIPEGLYLIELSQGNKGMIRKMIVRK